MSTEMRGLENELRDYETKLAELVDGAAELESVQTAAPPFVTSRQMAALALGVQAVDLFDAHSLCGDDLEMPVLPELEVLREQIGGALIVLGMNGRELPAGGTRQLDAKAGSARSPGFLSL